MKTYLNSTPTVADMRALELAAHRARSRELARLIRTGATGVKALIERLASAAHVGGRIGHA
jgi:hypothetical protein